MKKSLVKTLGPALPEFELVPVTDPAELVALERRCRATARAKAAAEKGGTGKPTRRE